MTDLEEWIYENKSPVEHRCPNCGHTWGVYEFDSDDPDNPYPGFNSNAQSVTFSNTPEE